MQIFIAPSKDMTDKNSLGIEAVSTPSFQEEAKKIALDMMAYSSEELAKMLKINPRLANITKLRFGNFLNPGSELPAVVAHNGIVFKYLQPGLSDKSQLEYAQNHLLIASFLYGLLRPLDAIKCYRLEGSIRLPGIGDKRIDRFWQPLLTDFLIRSVKKDDGILLCLASEEMKNLFDWKRVEKEVKVIQPRFQTRSRGKLRTTVVYMKMCHGAMARYALEKEIADPEKLKDFSFEGFAYSETESQPSRPCFTLET